MATQDKYDRQLRMWGADGQSRLNKANVLCLGISAAGTETLKNLVLPGVGFIRIVSAEIVTERTFSANFFVDPEDLGTHTAASVLKNLLELNPDVKGEVTTQDPVQFFQEQLLEGSNGVLKAATLEFSAKVNDFCAENHIKFVLVKDFGQTAYLRVYDPYYTTYQPKQDGERYDLKLNEPFPELDKIINEYPQDLFTLNQKEHRLVPFLVILIRELSIWKNAHNGEIPTGFQQQQEFRAQVTASGERLPDQENYTEALNNIASVFKPKGYIPDEVQELLDIAGDTAATSKDPFWKYVLGLQKFIQAEGRTPLSTTAYLRIKNAYNNQSAADFAQFKGNLSVSGAQGEEEDQKTFLKNWFNLAAVKYRTLSEELAAVNKGDWLYECEPLHGWYFVIRAADRFRKQHSRDPEPADYDALKALVDALLQAGLQENQIAVEEFEVAETLIRELCRGANSHIVTVASVIGGIASQEIIKLLTRQFTPLQNTLLFEGNRAHGAVAEF